MAESNLSFAKIVANPNAYAWSQVYNSGKLFAVLSLETKEDIKEKDYLNVLGKEIFDALEQEFYSLENKDLETIKEAVSTTSKKIPQDITCSFVVGSITKNVLYIYVLGNGRVSLKRGEKLGNLLEIKDQPSDSLKSASGFLQDEDVIILQTKQFSDVISAGTISEFTDNLPPSEIAENLAPLVHEKEEAGAAAIIINYKTFVESQEEIIAPLQEEGDEKTGEKRETQGQEVFDESPFYVPRVNGEGKRKLELKQLFFSLKSRFNVPRNVKLNHPRKVILTIIIIILIVFIGSVVFAINKQKNDKMQALFASVYPKAEKKYEEGEGLLGLNQNLARDSLTSAKQILESAKGEFPQSSSQEKQIVSLLAKVNSALSSTSGITSASVQQVDASKSPLLLAETKNSGLYFAQNPTSIYFLTDGAVYSLNKNGTNKKAIINNSNYWQDPGGLSTYYGNLYVLDKKQSQILKFVQTTGGFTKTNYFPSNTSPDFSKAVSIAIDSSIYVLSSDGTVSKFTKGSADNFSLSGLDKNLSNPTWIYTDANDSYIYVLDKGNSRIVVFDKNGVYKNQYQSGVIGKSTDFDVDEKNKVIYILSEGKVYELNLD